MRQFLTHISALACCLASVTACQMDPGEPDDLDSYQSPEPEANDGTGMDAILSLGAGTAAATGGFANDTTPVDMREYWPHTFAVRRYRRANGTLYMKRITKPHDAMQAWLPNEDGDVHFTREDHIPIKYGMEQTRFDNSWSMVKKKNKAVWEIADLFSPEHSVCETWCWGHGQVYTGSASGDPAILHGRPYGHRLGEAPYESFGVTMDSTNNLDRRPTPLKGWTLYTRTQLVAKYDTFKPAVGRGPNGEWGKGYGKTYKNVILMAFQHGTAGPSDRETCPSHPEGFDPVPGSRSFWQYSWLAPGVGVVQSAIAWDERSCSGFFQPEGKAEPIVYGYAIDER